jgi:hypothetical protein
MAITIKACPDYLNNSRTSRSLEWLQFALKELSTVMRYLWNPTNGDNSFISTIMVEEQQY